MNVPEMCEAVSFNVQTLYPDKVFLDSVILREINRLIGEIASVHHIRGLIQRRSVEIESEQVGERTREARGRMPRDFDHDILYARNDTTGREIGRVFANVPAMDRFHEAGVDKGSVESIATDNQFLWGRPCPEPAENIIIEYYQKPTPLKEGGSGPAWLSSHLHEGLLVDGASSRLLKRIREEIETGGVNVKYHLGEHGAALARLAEECKDSPRPNYYHHRPIQFF